MEKLRFGIGSTVKTEDGVRCIVKDCILDDGKWYCVVEPADFKVFCDRFRFREIRQDRLTAEEGV